MPWFWSSLSPLSFLMASSARTSATPPPGTTPSSTAARVACRGSSRRAFFFFFHFPFPRGPDLDHRHTAGEFRHAFLQLFTVVVRRGLFDLRLDLLDARF